MFCLDNAKVHQTLPGAGWRILHTGADEWKVTDDAVIAFVTYKELDCGSGATWIAPLLKNGLLSNIYGDEAYVEEYIRPDATPEDVRGAIESLLAQWVLEQKEDCPLEDITAAVLLAKAVKRG